MSDPRLTPANQRVAAAHLRGVVEAPQFVEGTLREVSAPVADLWDQGRKSRQRQLLRGDHVRVYEQYGNLNFVQSEKDGYVGYVDARALIAPHAPTHMVAVPASHIYGAADMKCADARWQSFGARVQVVGDDGAFFTLAGGGFLPKPHLRPLNKPFQDPVVVAQMLFGTPYLWGGNSARGIDCSGLVQTAMLACGKVCPADSDLQLQALGMALPEGTAPQRGDLFFWPGHVAMAVDGDTLIHANAYHMAVAYEPIQAAIDRIELQGDGRLLAHKRF